jgi:hypothetical protein
MHSKLKTLYKFSSEDIVYLVFFKRLINSTIIHEKPLTNYFGENFKRRLAGNSG